MGVLAIAVILPAIAGAVMMARSDVGVFKDDRKRFLHRDSMNDNDQHMKESVHDKQNK